MLPADEDAVLRSTAAPAWVDDAEAEAVPDKETVADAVLEAPVAGLVADGVVPVLLPQPVRAAARARMARPGPTWCFMMCSLAGVSC